MLSASYVYRSGLNEYQGFYLLNFGHHVRLYQLWLWLLWVLEMTEQLCFVCHNTFKEYGTTEYVSPWLCICQKRIEVKRSVQQLISHQCKCPTRTFKTTGRRVVYCRCQWKSTHLTLLILKPPLPVERRRRWNSGTCILRPPVVCFGGGRGLE